MIANSRKWAQNRGLFRKNEVHGADEWRIPTESNFSHTAVRGSSSSMRGSFDVEDS